MADILEPIADDDPRWRNFDYLKTKAVSDKAKGNNFKHQLVTGEESIVVTLGAGYSKVRATEPHLVNSRTGKQRLFTPTEHAKLKTIPVFLVAGFADSVAHEVLGQSVIANAFEAVGQMLGRLFLDMSNLELDMSSSSETCFNGMCGHSLKHV
ncbi:MAG: hypothetical protein KZQ66_04965 [Candidatus Thiodiazotropha sp. (ex Lucinoma aequizonata)]|nr:hypothetical protein [Candidatus Thiodiazotropha sp. (ex Lucinoma aequizonata)]MCU7887681.1 hypothetical protein [Candidatus Thiodiazotropha sp. (ex Lucinoma aequizonata)]MCU7897003.1 hypothetical protein [Candidatus Thiodiazotropha sp. (ex Lucinoma aequizonata)]MCU7900177.1 hypothetical protein [Candidatus Thiodiazotropha sp. (ex Lucinoma aequizonata)]MCU7901424.1 hypothetical protein [Candidatus Thiodiazotropha sp. (ex Lucinoma aequizonata)]